MTKKIPGLIFILLFAFSGSFPEERILQWPLKINNGYSSSFQEYRPGHFHGGIDIRTLQKTGLPVHAVMSGHIVKIRNVKRGSGKGIYIKHENGLRSIYFHLEKFTDNVEKILKRLQRSTGKKYTGNYILQKPIFVNKGQLIGYSGETGSGFPHLHLEIRDEENALLNPFNMIDFPKRDKNNPILKNLILRSVENTVINGKSGELSIPFKKINKNSFILQDKIFIDGEFEIILNSIDISDTGKRVAPAKLELYVNGDRKFNLDFKRFTYNDNNQLGFVYDMFFSSSSNYFFNLFNQKSFVMSGDSCSTGDIYDFLKPGKNDLKISVHDNFNNSSTGSFSIYKIVTPDIKIDPVYAGIGRNIIRIKELIQGSSTKIVLSLIDKSGNPVSENEFTIDEIKDRDKIEIPDDMAGKFLFMEFGFFIDNLKIKNKCFSFNNEHLENITDLDIEQFINRDTVIVRLKDSKIASNNVILQFIQGNKRLSVFPQHDSEGLFFAIKPMSHNTQAKLNFSIFNNMKLTARIQKRINLIKVTDGLGQKLKFDEIEILLGKRSVRENKALVVDKVSHPSEYPVLSDQYRIYPYTFPFLDKVLVNFHTMDKDPWQIGIFRYSLKNRKWYYTGTSISIKEGLYRSRTLTPGIFCLMRDIFKPEIYFKMSRQLKKSNLYTFKIVITDKGKGVNDESIKVVLNGVSTASEYDPDWKSLKIENFRSKVKTGWNILKVSLKDHGGNYSEKAVRFRVGG
ncbi:MAG: M23 family metallopeptidase [Acidobacteriota bacterium]